MRGWTAPRTVRRQGAVSPYRGNQRNTWPAGQTGARRGVTQHEIGAGSDAKVPDVGTSPTLVRLQPWPPNGLLPGHAHLADRRRDAQRPAGAHRAWARSTVSDSHSSPSFAAFRPGARWALRRSPTAGSSSCCPPRPARSPPATPAAVTSGRPAASQTTSSSSPGSPAPCCACRKATRQHSPARSTPTSPRRPRTDAARTQSQLRAARRVGDRPRHPGHPSGSTTRKTAPWPSPAPRRSASLGSQGFPADCLGNPGRRSGRASRSSSPGSASRHRSPSSRRAGSSNPNEVGLLAGAGSGRAPALGCRHPVMESWPWHA
jgi:hypothetical protein